VPGPLPKDPARRQRRNKAATRALLPAESAPIVGRPELPARTDTAWHPLAVQWWDDVWASPQCREFLRADLGALYRLVHLVDRWWQTGQMKLAVEIRLMEREFGLTPLSRRRLEWTVAQSEAAVEKRERQRSRQGRVIEHDPREVLA